MAILTQYALSNPEFAKIVGQATYTIPATNLYQSERIVENTNQLMCTESEYYYAEANGVKTGSTPYAGDCLVSSASKHGMNLVCLIYKVADKDPLRWTLSKDLYEWGFNNFSTVDLATLIASAGPVALPVENAADDAETLEFAAPDTGEAYITLDKSFAEGIANGTDTVEAETVLSEPLAAPIAKDAVLGEVVYTIKSTGQVIYQGNLIAPRDVAEAGAAPSESATSPAETQTSLPGEGEGRHWHMAMDYHCRRCYRTSGDQFAGGQSAKAQACQKAPVAIQVQGQKVTIKAVSDAALLLRFSVLYPVLPGRIIPYA